MPPHLVVAHRDPLGAHRAQRTAQSRDPARRGPRSRRRCRGAVPGREPRSRLRSRLPVAGLVAVAHPRLGEQPAGPGRVGFQLAPQLGHVEPEVAGRVGVARAPHLGQQLALGEQLAGVAEQDLQQVPFGRGQPDRLAAVPAMTVLAARSMTRSPSADHRLVGRGGGPPDGGAHPGQQFLHAERLGHVVVRAGVQRLDLVGAVGPAGQHDDRGLGPAAQPLDDLDAVQVGQAQVEEHQVRGVAAAVVSASDPVAAVSTS